MRLAFYNYSNYKKSEYAVYGQEENRIEHIKEHPWPVPMKNRPKSLPDLKQDTAIEKMIKIEKAEEEKKQASKPKKKFNLLNYA